MVLGAAAAPCPRGRGKGCEKENGILAGKSRLALQAPVPWQDRISGRAVLVSGLAVSGAAWGTGQGCAGDTSMPRGLLA